MNNLLHITVLCSQVRWNLGCSPFLDNTSVFQDAQDDLGIYSTLAEYACSHITIYENPSIALLLQIYESIYHKKSRLGLWYLHRQRRFQLHSVGIQYLLNYHIGSLNAFYMHHLISMEHVMGLSSNWSWRNTAMSSSLCFPSEEP